jgi:hypothetical protein
MGFQRKVFQQVWKPHPAAGPDSRFNAQSMLIRHLFVRSIGSNCATWALFKTYCLIVSEERARRASPNFGQSFTRIIKYLLSQFSGAA